MAKKPKKQENLEKEIRAYFKKLKWVEPFPRIKPPSLFAPMQEFEDYEKRVRAAMKRRAARARKRLEAMGFDTAAMYEAFKRREGYKNASKKRRKK